MLKGGEQGGRKQYNLPIFADTNRKDGLAGVFESLFDPEDVSRRFLRRKARWNGSTFRWKAQASGLFGR